MYGQFLMTLGRKHSKMMIGLSTGCINQRHMLHKMNLAKSPICRRCEVEYATNTRRMCRKKGKSVWFQLPHEQSNCGWPTLKKS